MTVMGTAHGHSPEHYNENIAWHGNYLEPTHKNMMQANLVCIHNICIAVYVVAYRPTYLFMQCITYKSMQMVIPENEVKNVNVLMPIWLLEQWCSMGLLKCLMQAKDQESSQSKNF